MIPKYHVSEGLRFVEPYFYKFNTTVKGRWFGRSLKEVFETEFGQNADHFCDIVNKEYLQLVRKDSVLLSGASLFHHILQQGDTITNVVHKHEPPVTGDQIKVLYEDTKIVVVNKPSGVPVHPCGAYNYNSVTKILQHDFDPAFESLYSCHRLDKLTSGIVIFAKTSNDAQIVQSLFKADQVRKTYLSKVRGKFPDGVVECNDPVFLLNPGRPPAKSSLRIQLKSARTKFKRVQYSSDADSSIVECMPETGRTHQIRIHLRNLNFPISNDPTYGHGNQVRNECEMELVRKIRHRQYGTKLADVSEDTNFVELGTDWQQKLFDEYNLNKDKILNIPNMPACEVCYAKKLDIPPQSLRIFLHAYKYKILAKDGSLAQEFRTELPNWCFDEYHA